MSKISKIIIFLLIILLSVCTFSLATDIDMNITEQSNTSNGNLSNYSNNTNNSRNYSTNSSNSISDALKSISKNNSSVTPEQALQESMNDTVVKSILENNIDNALSFSNVLNILLIVVGVVLILLSIAILIRLNS